MILMLYLQLGCLLSLALQIGNSEFGLHNVFVVISFFFVLLIFHRDRSIKPQPWDPAGQLLTFYSFMLDLCNT